MLDVLLAPLVESREATYSRPLSYVGFTKESVEVDGEIRRVAPRLKYGGAHLSDPEANGSATWPGAARSGCCSVRAAAGLLCWPCWSLVARAGRRPDARGHGGGLARRDTDSRGVWPADAAGSGPAGRPAVMWAGHYHVLGTDLTGNDVLYQALKSIRTAFVIGTLATVATLPLAVGLGILAGYFRGWVDEVIQYLYTVLSSVPNVLLIAACVLMVQVFIDKHPELFETGAERADLKLFLLCAVLGLTGWAGPVPAAARRDAEAARTGIRAGGQGLRRQ